MERLVRVMDSKTGGGSVFLDLPDLLPVLEPEARAWTWSIQRMPEASWEDDSGIDPSHLAARIAADPRGHVMDLSGMWDFAREVYQVVWGEFVAAGSPDDLPRVDDSEPWVGEHALAGLYAFDSSFWMVGGPSVVIDRVIATFDRAHEIDPREWIRDAR